MKTRILFALVAVAIAAPLSRSQVLDSPVTVPLGVAAGYEAGDNVIASFSGSFGGGVSGSISGYHEWSPGWYETGMTWFQLRPGKDYYFFVESSEVGAYLLRFDAPTGHRLIVDNVDRSLHDGDAGFSSWFGTQYKVRLEAVGASSAGLIGESSSLRPQRVIWQVSMGYLRNGGGAGAIELRETTVSDAVNSGKLYYDTASSEVHVVYGAGGTLRQVKASDGLADIVTLSGTSYEVRFYRISQVGTFNGSVYALTGNPFIKYEVWQVATDHLKIKMTRGSRIETSELKKTTSTSWEVSDWTTDGQACQRTLLYDFPSGSTIEDLTVKNGSTVATRVRKTYTSIGGSMELTSEVAGYGTVPQTTTYTYYNSAGSPGSYHKLWSVTRPDGSWVKFDYDNGSMESQGMLTRKYEPYMDSPATAAAATTANCKLTEYTYEADWTMAERRPVVIVSKVNAVKTGHVDLDYADTTVGGKPVVVETRTEYAESSLSGSQARTTVAKYFREDAGSDVVQYWPGQIHSVTNPDGTKKAVSYREGEFDLSFRQFTASSGQYSYYRQELVVSGSATDAGGGTWSAGSYPVDTVYIVPNQSTMEETIRSISGTVVYRATWVHNGTAWVRPDGILTGSSVDREPLYHYHNNGRYSAEWNYVDGRTDWFKDADGVQTSYTYDRHGRIATATKTGIIGTSPFPSPAAITTTYGYDASNRLVSTSTSAGTGETLATSRAFDQAGRPISSTHHDSGSISFSYPSAREVTMTLPGPVAGGGTRTVTTETYLDGRFKRRTGNADIPEYHWFMVDTGNGRELVHRKPTESTGDRWHNTWLDWLGRPNQVVVPTFDEPSNPNAINVVDYMRSGPDRVDRTRNWSLLNGWNAPLTPDNLYAYGKMGELVTATADIDQDGVSDLGDKDRVAKSEARFEVYGSDTWMVSRTKVLPTSGSPTERNTSEVRVKLTGLGMSQLSVVEQYDTAGRKSTETVTVDRSTRVRTSTAYADGVTSPATTLWHNGVLFRSTSPASVVTTMSYDALGRVSKVSGRSTVEQKFTYVSGKTLVYEKSSKYGAGPSDYLLTDRFTYDNAGRVTLHESFNYSASSSSAHTGTRRFEYDALGQVVRQWGNAVQPVQYEFNTFGQMTKMWTFDTGTTFATQGTWPGGTGRLTQWAYQARTGLLQTRTDAASPTGHTISYEYNLRGQLRKRTQQRGSGSNVVTDYIYYEAETSSPGDISNRTGELKKIDYSDSTTDINFTYDRMGRVSGVVDAAGTRSFAYRDGSDLQLDYELLPSFFGSRKVTRTYDAGSTAGRYSGFAFKEADDSATWQNAGYTYSTGNGRLDTITRASMTATGYTYETGSDLVRKATIDTWYRENHWQSWRNVTDDVESRWTGTTPRLVANYASNYDWRMNREDVELTGELASSQGGASGVKTEYATYLTNDVWDRDELRQTKVYSLSPTTEITARYRKWEYSVGQNRAKEYQNGTWLQTYNTNTVDEISSITGTGENDQEEDAPSATHQHDWAGNMTDDGTWTFTYDAENRPVKMQKTGNSTRLELKYDYLGRRIEKAVFANSTTQTPTSRTRFVYDGWNLIAELNAESSNAVLRTFTWGLDASHTVGGAGGVGGLVRMEQGGVEYYPVYDPSHNVTGLMRKNTNGTLDLVASYVLGPFGEVISATTYSGFTDTNPFRFSTKYTDAETGLVYFGHRYYHPKLGRFINRDPAGESGGVNLHGYVGNNPANRNDFLGMWEVGENDDGTFTASGNFYNDAGDNWVYYNFNSAAEAEWFVQNSSMSGGMDFEDLDALAGTASRGGFNFDAMIGFRQFANEFNYLSMVDAREWVRKTNDERRHAYVDAGPIGQSLRQARQPTATVVSDFVNPQRPLGITITGTVVDRAALHVYIHQIANSPVERVRTEYDRLISEARTNGVTPIIAVGRNIEMPPFAVYVGSWDHGVIDLDDVEKYSTRSPGFGNTQLGVITHEVFEQLFKQVEGASDYLVAHRMAIQFENLVNGTTRTERRGYLFPDGSGRWYAENTYRAPDGSVVIEGLYGSGGSATIIVEPGP